MMDSTKAENALDFASSEMLLFLKIVLLNRPNALDAARMRAFTSMHDNDTPMPKLAGKKLDQDECEPVNMADTVQMINDYNEALTDCNLPFVPAD
eukprot:g4288.t1